jgi:uncharacterized protein YndB with AHSA1/START domain
MSKKKKAAPVKAGKKKPVKKTAQKAVKQAAKKSATKKPAAKIKKATKSAKKSPAKATKSAPKKHTLKTIVKKIAKVAKSKIKAITKPAAKAISSKNSNSKNSLKKGAPAPSAKNTKVAKPVAKALLSVKPGQKNGTAAHDHKNNGSSKISVKSTKPEKEPVRNSTPVSRPEEKLKKGPEPVSKKQLSEKKSNDVLAITNTIPVKAKNELSPSKIASISYSITNPVKRTDSYAVKPEKEPAGKFELEFVVHASAEMLYEFLSTPSGLSEWFCDDLNIRNGIYTFIWDDQLQQARLLKTVDLQLVRFQWVDKTDGSYFEFKIQRDDLTNDISLIITDFAETASERESSKLLWHSQVEKLMHVIGSIF